jgi:hypothetical protein
MRELRCVNFYGHNDPLVVGLQAGVAPFGDLTNEARRIVHRSMLHVISRDRVGGLYTPAGYDLGPFSTPKGVYDLHWVYDFNSALNPSTARTVASDLYATIVGDSQRWAKAVNKPAPDLVFLITGYSAGGVTALTFGQLIKTNRQEVMYIGLSDPAFQRGESDDLMQAPGVSAKYMKNYYQTLENDPAVTEIHDAVAGFANFNLDGEVDKDDPHTSAVRKGNDKMYWDIVYCVNAFKP